MNRSQPATARAAKKLGEQFIPAMEQWQAEIEELWSAILPSPVEDAMLEHAEEQDEPTVIRMLLECINRQHLAGTIAAAQAVLAWSSKGHLEEEK